MAIYSNSLKYSLKYHVVSLSTENLVAVSYCKFVNSDTAEKELSNFLCTFVYFHTNQLLFLQMVILFSNYIFLNLLRKRYRGILRKQTCHSLVAVYLDDL